MTKGENGVMNSSGPVSEFILLQGLWNKKVLFRTINTNWALQKRKKMKNQTEYEIFGVSYTTREK